MKLRNYVKTSLARQFGVLTIFIMVAFTLLISVLIVYENQLQQRFERENEQFERKMALASDLEYSFNLAISEMRAYLAYGGLETYYNNVEKQREIVDERISNLTDIAKTPEDEYFVERTGDFYNYYFKDVLPRSKEFYDRGQYEEVTTIAVSQNASEQIRTYQSNVKNYMNGLRVQHSRAQEGQKNKFLFIQLTFVGVLLLLLGIMAILVRIMLWRIRAPLSKLTIAASEIAEGKPVILPNLSNRQDELGVLSMAFEKMTRSIQEKEDDLNAQNQELLAQQEALHAQQTHLENALNKTRSREIDLKRRNDLNKGLSNSLDKREVLQSIVKTMSNIVGADKGIIVLLEKGDEHASFGVSEQGVQQFIEHLEGGLITRIQDTKKPYVIKRESFFAEKGYHTTQSLTFDLILPVHTALGDLAAVMMFSRYDKAFLDSEIHEYDNLSKQISISLDKIKLFEQTEEDRLLTQNILDTIKEGIQLVNVSGRVIQVNQKLCDMLECQSGAIVDSEYEKWTADLAKTVENGTEMKKFFDQALFTGDATNPSFVYHQTSPIQRVIQVYCESLTRDGEKIGTVIVHRDITKEYEVDAMKSELVSTVSHELRTPLASVLGFAELMLHKELPAERQKKYLTAIYQEAYRLTALVNDFLDVQKMEAGKQEYHKLKEDILPLLRDIIETYEINHTSHVFRLSAETANTVVFGDGDKLAQVFNNLLSNAVKYSPEGGSVDVRIFEENRYLNVAISDEGLGIPADAIEHIFEKFYRVNNSDRRKIGGTGLGLAIVKEIIKAHAGAIFVESALNERSIFTVQLPMVRKDASDSQSKFCR